MPLPTTFAGVSVRGEGLFRILSSASPNVSIQYWLVGSGKGYNSSNYAGGNGGAILTNISGSVFNQGVSGSSPLTITAGTVVTILVGSATNVNGYPPGNYYDREYYSFINIGGSVSNAYNGTTDVWRSVGGTLYATPQGQQPSTSNNNVTSLTYDNLGPWQGPNTTTNNPNGWTNGNTLASGNQQGIGGGGGWGQGGNGTSGTSNTINTGTFKSPVYHYYGIGGNGGPGATEPLTGNGYVYCGGGGGIGVRYSSYGADGSGGSGGGGSASSPAGVANTGGGATGFNPPGSGALIISYPVGSYTGTGPTSLASSSGTWVDGNGVNQQWFIINSSGYWTV
jgi:hypothetical protein